MIRVVCFIQWGRTPVAWLHQWSDTDMSYYDGWALDIAHGDVLSRRAGVPMHHWHTDVARAFRADYGLASPGPLDSPAEDAANTRLWAGWLHVPQFYQDPLYAYGLAAVFGIFGHEVRLVVVIQLVGGALCVVLIWDLTRRAFDDLTAAVAALVSLLCGPLLFYELLLLRDAAMVAVSLLLIWLLFQPRVRRTNVGMLVLGMVIAVGCLLKTSFVLTGILAWLGLLIFDGFSARHGLLVGAVAVLLMPLAMRNAAVGVPILSVASSGPLTFVVSNDAAYPPDSGFGVDSSLLAHFLGGTPGRWRDAARMTSATQSLTGYGTQLWDKWTRVWHWYEMPNNENFYYARSLIPALSWLPVTFWSIAPLGLVGIALSWKEWRRRWPLIVLLCATIAPLLIFYVLGRFRVAVIAAVIPFAAHTIVTIARQLAGATLPRAALTIGAVAMVGAWTGQPLGPHQILIRTSDWILPFSTFYAGRIDDAAHQREWRVAADLYAQYFDRYPLTPGELQMGGAPLRQELAAMHRECADLFEAAGDRPDAAEQRGAAERITHQ